MCFICPNRLDPIWTLKTGSLFLLTTESRRLFLDDGMRFIVKDFDSIGKDEVLGIVHVKPQILYKAEGQRMEFKIQPPHGSKASEVPGYLVLRVRRATEYDQKFMADYENTKGNQGVASVEHPKATTNFVKTMTTFNKRKDKDGIVRVSLPFGLKGISIESFCPFAYLSNLMTLSAMSFFCMFVFLPSIVPDKARSGP